MTKEVKVGSVIIGGGHPVSVQSMTNTDTADYDATFSQIKQLKSAGCDIVRLAVRDMSDVRVCQRYLAETKIPLVADIQFDYRLAVACADIGFDKVRFNPGNTSKKGLNELSAACKANDVPIRIGINSGSLEKELKEKYGVCAESLVESALRAVSLLEKSGFEKIVISVKSSNVRMMTEAYRLLSSKCGYPLHIGVTESGQGEEAVIKSAIGIGALLLDGIGDTVRVSLTGDPVNEIYAANKILRAIGIKEGCDVVSCPTCARCHYDLESLVIKCKEVVKDVDKPLKIAIMGCVVNGPGESADADIGIAGGEGKAVLFKKGKVYKTLDINDAETEFFNELRNLIR